MKRKHADGRAMARVFCYVEKVQKVRVIERRGEVLRKYGWGKDDASLPSYVACTEKLWRQWRLEQRDR